MRAIHPAFRIPPRASPDSENEGFPGPSDFSKTLQRSSHSQDDTHSPLGEKVQGSVDLHPADLTAADLTISVRLKIELQTNAFQNFADWFDEDNSGEFA